MATRPIPSILGRTLSLSLKGDNKELVVVPGASHTDLYDRMDIIPFNRIVEFFNKNLDK